MYDSCKPTDYMAHQAPLSKDFPSKITGVGCHFLLQGIFLTQGYNLGLLQAVSCIAGIFFIDSDSKDTYINIMEYYSAMRKAILLLVTWLDMEGIKLREIIGERQTMYDIT